MPTLNQTLERLVSQDAGLMTNPSFHRFVVSGPDGAPTTERFELGPGGRIPFSNGSLPSGWLPFGSAVTGIVLSETELGFDAPELNDAFGLATFPASFCEDNPLVRKAGRPYSGLGVTVAQGRVGGIMQRLPGGPALRGKKVRVFGAYKVTLPDTRTSGAETPLGISVWLKGAVHAVTAKGATLFDSAGATPATVSKWGSVVSTSPSATFSNTNAGDTLWLGETRRVYQVASVASPNVTVAGFVHEAGVGVNWSVGRRAPAGGVDREANWHGARGIHIRAADYGLPGAVLRVADPNAEFHEAAEWFVPGLDALVYPSDGTGVHAFGADGATDAGGDLFSSPGAAFLSTVPNSAGTPIGDLVLVVPGEGAFDIVDVVDATSLEVSPAMTGSLAGKNYLVASRHTLTDADIAASVLFWGAPVDPDTTMTAFFPGAAPPALDGGASPGASQAKIWFLDAVDWDGVPASGNFQLFEQVAEASGDVEYFDEVVEIPAGLAMSEDEVYLVALPANPTTFDDLDNVASVFFYYLQVAVVGEAASEGNGAEDRIIRSALHSESRRQPPSRGDLQLPFREPLWVPVEFSLDLGAVKPLDFDFTKISELDLRPNVTGHLQIGDGSSQALASFYWFPFPTLPIGTVLERVRISMGSGSNSVAASVDYRLYQFFADPPAYSTGVVRAAISDTVSDTASPSDVIFSLAQRTAGGVGSIYRHLLGFPWPVSDAALPGDLDPAQSLRPSRFYLGVSPQGTDTWQLRYSGIHGRAWVDARALRGQLPHANATITP